MTQEHVGWLTFVAAVAVMAGLLGNEIMGMTGWAEAFTPQFVGKSLIHLGTVVGAFLGGRQLPQPK